MKKLYIIVLLIWSIQTINAQNWGTTGNSGLTPSNFLGTTDAKDVIFKANNAERGRLASTGFWRFGSAKNYAKIDSAGKLSFGGTGAYQVAANKYAFQFANNPNYGLFFNSTNMQYEFRNNGSVPIFYVNANNGNGVFNGTLKIGAYTLPATDGTNGQVLTTNGGGIVSWAAAGNTYTAGTGISISGNTITNTAPGQTVTLTASGAAAVTGTYPNFNIAGTDAQTLSLSGNSLSISNGNTVALPQTVYTAGNGVDVTGNTITNTAPDQTVTLTGSGAAAVTGTYPNFNIACTDAQTLSLSGNSLSISNGNTVALPQTIYTAGNGIVITGDLISVPFLKTDETGNTATGQYTLVNTTGSYNSAYGFESLQSNTTGVDNTANGAWSLDLNTTGSQNTANGAASLYFNTTGGYNIANGSWSLFSNTTGSYNAASGFMALYANTTGSFNIANGSQALYSNTTGNFNTANGYQALYSNTTGNLNTANGYQALLNNFDGSQNVANGTYALSSNSGGISNTANGYQSLYNNTTGNDNTATGVSTLVANTMGNFNSATASNALHSNTTGSYNIANGYKASFKNTTGSSNIAIGVNALYNNTVGNGLVAIGDSALYNQAADPSGIYGNTAIGSKALYSNTIGYSNTANGYQTLYSNTKGSGNTANGYASLSSNTSGLNNTANGSSALSSNTTGNGNTASGYMALGQNTTGYSNIAIGTNALNNNTDGHNLVAIGDSALYSQVTNNLAPNDNTAVGSKALYSNTTGVWNVANGFNSLYSNTEGYANTAAGWRSLYSNTNGSYNTAVGNQSLYLNTTGRGNTAFGISTLSYNIIGSYNTACGYSADVYTGELTNATVIGYAAVVDASNKVRIGNSDVTSIGGQVGWTSFSDGRYKKNIKEDVKGLTFINALRPVTYTLDLKALNDYYNRGRKLSDSAYQQMKEAMAEDEATGSKIIHTGFIAQEVEAAAQKLNYDFDGVDRPQTKDGLYGLRYSEFVVPLVKAVQELSKDNNDKTSIIDSLKKNNQNLNSKVDELEGKLNQLKDLVLSIQQTQQQCSPCSAKESSATNINRKYAVISDETMLEQNVPNPFTNVTTIGYTLPQKFTSAKIIITDKNGRQLKQLNLTNAGKGTVTVDASTLPSGAYNYSLYVDGRLVATKQMISAK